MPAKLPQNVLDMRGRSHQTKAEKEKRRATEPKAPKVKKLRAPVWLPEYLRDEFHTIGDALREAGLLSKLDIDILARYVMARDAWVAAHRQAREALDTGDPKLSAVWGKVARNYFDQCQSCAGCMGLTITSRCRLVVPEVPKDPADEDPLSRMLRERAERRQA